MIKTFHFTQNKLKDLFFAAVFLLLVGGAFLSYQRIEDLVKAGDLVNHTNVVKLKLEELMAAIKDGESAQRGYLLTHDTIYLNQYRNALPLVHTLFDGIDVLVKDNSIQRKNSMQVRSLLDMRFETLDSVRSKFEKTGQFDRNDIYTGKIRMDAVREALLKMQGEEDRLLEIRIKEKKRYEFISPLFILMFTLVVLVIVIYAFDRTGNDKRLLKNMNSSLEQKNDELARAENFSQLLLDSSVDIIASFDNDLNYKTVNKRSKDLIDKEPAELIGKNVLDVYPDLAGSGTHAAMLDALKGKVVHLELLQGLVHTKKYFDVFFIPLFIGGNISGILSITRDITELVDANENLKNINAELAKSNKELVSFNHIASHDLQEPLRKIQIFTDRILEESGNSLPKEVTANFGRITDAALRMRKLIDALLSYSLATKGEIQFILTDLNLLFKEAEKHLAETDIKNEMLIEAEVLPKANVIPIQFEQLLINLLGNSIKYSKPQQMVQIKIRAKYLSGKNIQESDAVAGKNYLCIEISDNGIGFEQDYAEKIFGLFQRLHSKNEYSGTGIGLAICKKIMENHNGFITASGQPGAGATFRLYLPA